MLVENAAKWTTSYIASNGTTSPWTRSDIKAALVEETNAKCAYCEAEMLAVAFGDIEHMLPRSVFPELVVDWRNLTLACSRCNGNKASKYDSKIAFINPYVDPIEEHILFLGAVAHPVSDRGFYTVNEIGLNDGNRVESRDRELKSLELLLQRHEAAAEGYIKTQLAELIRLKAERGQYTAAMMSYLALRKVQLGHVAAQLSP